MPDIVLPQTRYYGSKRKIVDKIWEIITVDAQLDFDTVLDIFGGSGSFAYYAKLHNKKVFYNDIFQFNYVIGKKLIEQSSNDLSYQDAINLFNKQPDINYESYIEDYYQGIYFTDEENSQIDIYIQNVLMLESENMRCSALYILFQSCLMKRPYNLFHRKNLDMRINYNGGNFGNKKTWERGFQELFVRFIDELTKICFDNGRDNLSHNYSALNYPFSADLLYIDPPYFTSKSATTYHSKYHFLEGLTNYHSIPDFISFNKVNREVLINVSREFEDKANFLNELAILIGNHPDSHIAISYRNNGVPSIKEIGDLLRSFDRFEVLEYNLGNYNYALNKNNNVNEEILFVCKKVAMR